MCVCVCVCVCSVCAYLNGYVCESVYVCAYLNGYVCESVCVCVCDGVCDSLDSEIVLVAYLVANDLGQVQLPAHINDMLELPTSDIAHTDVVHLPREDQVMEGSQSLFYWGAAVPTMCLES